MTSKYHVSQIQNGKTLNYGNFNANSHKEAAKMASKIAKEKYPQYNRKTPFIVKEQGHEPQKVMYCG